MAHYFNGNTHNSISFLYTQLSVAIHFYKVHHFSDNILGSFSDNEAKESDKEYISTNQSELFFLFFFEITDCDDKDWKCAMWE